MANSTKLAFKNHKNRKSQSTMIKQAKLQVEAHEDGRIEYAVGSFGRVLITHALDLIMLCHHRMKVSSPISSSS